MHDAHEQARQWIALGEVDDLPEQQRLWLQTHLQGCEACRNCAEEMYRLIRSVRSVPLAAGPGLVWATQMRVRERAHQLREERDRLWLVGMSCFVVGLSTALTTPLLWRAFQWIGNWTEISRPVWEGAFVIFAVTPAIVTSVLLLGRGIHTLSLSWTRLSSK